MQLPITLANVGELDHGSARLVIDDAIRAAVADVDDRGQDGKPRTVVVTLTLQKVEGSDTISAHVEAEARVPKRRTGRTFATVGRLGGGEVGLLFQAHSPGDPFQKTIDELEPRGGTDAAGSPD